MPRKVRAAVYTRDYPQGARAAIYTRVSSVEQLEGYSLEAQETACERLAQERGWEITARYTDPGASARTVDRPGFQQMLEDALSGRFDVIIVHKLDRFSRSVTSSSFLQGPGCGGATAPTNQPALDNFKRPTLRRWGAFYISQPAPKKQKSA